MLTEHDWWPVTGQWFYWLIWNVWQVTLNRAVTRRRRFSGRWFSVAPSAPSPSLCHSPQTDFHACPRWHWRSRTPRFPGSFHDKNTHKPPASYLVSRGPSIFLHKRKGSLPAAPTFPVEHALNSNVTKPCLASLLLTVYQRTAASTTKYSDFGHNTRELRRAI